MPAARPKLSETELALACTEILVWRKSGIYEGTVLKALADDSFSYLGPDAMRQAEDFVLLETAKVFVESMDTRPSLIDDLEVSLPGIR